MKPGISRGQEGWRDGINETLPDTSQPGGHAGGPAAMEAHHCCNSVKRYTCSSSYIETAAFISVFVSDELNYVKLFYLLEHMYERFEGRFTRVFRL